MPAARKQQNFSLLDELELLEDHSSAEDTARDGLGPHLIFRRPVGGKEVNFRAGDTLILYPRRKHGQDHQLSVLDAQVVKVTLAEDLTAARGCSLRPRLPDRRSTSARDAASRSARSSARSKP